MKRLAAIPLLALAAIGLAAAGGTAFALQLEERSDFCASCHTQPEVEYVARGRAGAPSDLSSAHLIARGVRCIDCHSGAGAFGRAAGLRQGAHDLAAYLSGIYANPATTTNPLPDENCAKCHGGVFAGKGLRNHYHFYLRDWQQQEPGIVARCITCHTSHTQGASRTVKYAVDGKFNGACNACHAFSGIR